jgi:hypothetical protein
MSRPALGLAVAAVLLAVPGRTGPHLNAPQPTRLPPASVRAGAPAAIVLDLRLPKGWRLDPAAPLRWRFTEAWAGFTFTKRKDSLSAPKLPLRIAFRAAPGATGARLVVDYRYCRGAGAPDCRSETADYLVVLQARDDEKRTEVPVTVEAPKP